MAPPRWDPTVNLGHILTIVAILIGGGGSALAAYTTVSGAISNHELRLLRIEEEVSSTFRPSMLVINSLAARVSASEVAIDRGRSERMDFQRQTAATNQAILEALSKIREEVAAIRATQKATVHP